MVGEFLKAWKRTEPRCELSDAPSCPKTRPGRLTPTEIWEMREMVTSTEFRHMSIRALALYAQRVGRVFACPGTWWKRAKAFGWSRPRLRVYPPKPTEGV